MNFNVTQEIDKAIDFAEQVIVGDTQLPPTMAGFRPPSTDRLIIGCRPLDPDAYDHDKDKAFLVMAGVVRGWGATELLFVADTHVVKAPVGEKLDPSVPPSQDPRAVDAICVYHFNRQGQQRMVTQFYHLDDDGTYVRDERHDTTEVQGSQGRVPDVVGTIMTEMGDESLKEFTELSGAGIEAILTALAMSGYMVTCSEDGVAKAYVVGTEEDLEMLQADLKESGWDEVQRIDVTPEDDDESS